MLQARGQEKPVVVAPKEESGRIKVTVDLPALDSFEPVHDIPEPLQ